MIYGEHIPKGYGSTDHRRRLTGPRLSD